MTLIEIGSQQILKDGYLFVQSALKKILLKKIEESDNDFCRFISCN